MLRNILIALCVMALAAPAFGYETIWDGSPDDPIKLDVSVDPYIQIQWLDTEIHFNEGTGPDTTWDFWADQLANVAYQRCPDDGNKHPPEPFAGDQSYAQQGGRYYESWDAAIIEVISNGDLTMMTQAHGNLKGTLNRPYDEIPTWFTIALCPFMINGTWLDDGVGFPFTPEAGCYVGDAGGGRMHYCVETFPNQHPFPCSQPFLGWWILGPLDPVIEGTIRFFCRIERHGMMDKGDQYRTTINVLFITP